MSEPRLGRIQDNHVCCDLCDWQRAITSFEMAEAMLQSHLRERHGKTLMYAIETETGKVKPTPEPRQ